MSELRVRRLDADGNPVGEPQIVGIVDRFAHALDVPMELRACTDGMNHWAQPLGQLSMTLNLTSTATTDFMRAMFGPGVAAKWRRAARHHARIVVVPKKRRKHGRVGVYR